MKADFKYKAKQASKKKRIDWKKRMINVMMMLLVANFLWDIYSRVPEIKIYSDQCYQSTAKYSKIYYDKALRLFSTDQED